MDVVGRQQAAAVAPLLAAARPSVLLSSDLSRARDTALPLAAAAGIDLRLDSRLRELDLGLWQGLTGAQARERFPDEHAAWQAGVDVVRGGGETYRQAGVRAAGCIEEVLVELPADGVVIAVTHGGTARGTLGVLLDSAPDRWWRTGPLANACWSVLVQHRLGWRLEEHGVGPGALSTPASWRPQPAAPGL